MILLILKGCLLIVCKGPQNQYCILFFTTGAIIFFLKKTLQLDSFLLPLLNLQVLKVEHDILLSREGWMQKQSTMFRTC